MVMSGNILSAEEKLSRKRNAARLRQQACRDRKRKIAEEIKALEAKALSPLSPEGCRPLFPHPTSAFSTPRAEQPNKPVRIITPPSSKGLRMSNYQQALCTPERYHRIHHAYSPNMPMMPYPPSFPSEAPWNSSGTTSELRQLAPRSQMHFTFQEPKPVDMPASHNNTRPPVKRIFIQRADQQAKENEQATRSSPCLSSQEVRKPLTQISRSLMKHHYRSSSDADKMDAVGVILSLKTSNSLN